MFGSDKRVIMNTKHTLWQENAEQKWRLLLLEVLKRIRHKLVTNLGVCAEC